MSKQNNKIIRVNKTYITYLPPQSSNKAEPTLALKPRGDVTRSPKQGYQWPQKWTCVQQKFFKKKNNKTSKDGKNPVVNRNNSIKSPSDITTGWERLI